MRTQCERNANASKENASEPVFYANPRTQEPKIKNTVTKVPTPEGVSQSVWDEFIVHRKAKGGKVTQLVVDGIAKESTKAGWKLEDALKETIVRNWQSFKADWVLKGEKTEQPKKVKWS
jgi:hypothetical protein